MLLQCLRRKHRRLVIAMVAGAALSARSMAVAAAPADRCPVQPPASSHPMERARVLFEVGFERLTAGDCAAAVGCFLQSRELAPRESNTKNAAICLERLDRPDEAAEMYRDVLDRFSSGLAPDERARIEQRITELEKKLGSVRIDNVDAVITIDGQEQSLLPRGASIRLLPGEHEIRAVKEGYQPITWKGQVQAGDKLILTLTAAPALRRRPDGPRAPRQVLPPAAPPAPLPSGWFLGAFGGFAGGATLNSDAERDANAECTKGNCPGVVGFMAGGRGGYLSEFGLAWEVTAGYIALWSKFQQSDQKSYEVDEAFSINYRVELDHDIALRGPFGGTGLSVRVPLRFNFGLLARATIGVISAKSADVMGGVAVDPLDGTTRHAITVSNGGETLRSTIFYLSPELGVEGAWTNLRVSLVLGVLLSPAEGPPFGARELDVTGGCPGTPEDIRCAPSSPVPSSGRAYGPFVLWIPQIAVSYTF